LHVSKQHTLSSFQKLQGIVRDLQEIDKIRHKVSDIQVPLEVFDYIDTGRNPQLYTKDCMEKAVSKNEEVMQILDRDCSNNYFLNDFRDEKCFQLCLHLNLSHSFQVKGKIDAYRMFKAKLLVELSSVFPKEISHYRALRGDERVNP